MSNKKANANVSIVPVENEENIQLIPVEVLVISTDNITRQIFDATNDAEKFDVHEGQKLFSKVKFLHKAGKFNQLDRLVYNAIISEVQAGNNIFSIRRLWRRIGGNKHTLTPKMRQIIFDSVEKMAQSRIEIDLTDVNEKRHYTDKKELIYRRNVIPCDTALAKINGQVVNDAVIILKGSPVFDSVKDKKQFTTCDADLLDVPDLRNTETTLKIKGYLLCRTIEIIGSHKKNIKHFGGRTKGGKLKFVTNKKLNERILLKTLLEQCELEDALKWQRQDILKTISKIMNHFKDKGLILDWHFEKEHGKNRAIKFTF